MVRTMSSAISPEAKKAEQNFLLIVKAAGIVRVGKSYQYQFWATPYRVYAYVDDELCAAMGGKVRAMRLLRISTLIMELSKLDPKFIDPIESAFEELVSHFPLLDSYFQAASLRGRFHTWIRQG